MKFANTLAFAALAAASVATTDASAAAATASNTLPRIHPAVHRTLRQQNTVNLILTLKEGTAKPINAVKEADFATRGQQIAALVQSLETHAAKSQQEVSSLLAKESGGGALFTKTKSFWITNQVYVENATLELVEKLASLSSIAEITEEEVIPLNPVVADTPVLAVDNATTVEWGVDKISAKSVWATGNIGQNVVVGIVDSGARGTHTLISGSYRNDGFSWYDPQSKREAPYDNNGHGTHVTGTIAGDNGIGVAPGAKWIACRGCRDRNCVTSDLLECFQFMTCPTNPSGTAKDCSKAPQVINNSWSGPSGNTYDSAVAAWRSVGIIPVFANGNNGPGCTTVGSPAENPDVIGVGSTNVNDGLATTSSKGPSRAGVLKPDVSAPGENVRSSWNSGDSALNTISGTSMASPHVTGVVALLLSAKPGLTFTQAKDAITKTAVKTLRASGRTCGSTSDSVWPNNQYGHGRLNAQAAVAFVRAL